VQKDKDKRTKTKGIWFSD